MRIQLLSLSELVLTDKSICNFSNFCLRLFSWDSNVSAIIVPSVFVPSHIYDMLFPIPFSDSSTSWSLPTTTDVGAVRRHLESRIEMIHMEVVRESTEHHHTDKRLEGRHSETSQRIKTWRCSKTGTMETSSSMSRVISLENIQVLDLECPYSNPNGRCPEVLPNMFRREIFHATFIYRSLIRLA